MKPIPFLFLLTVLVVAGCATQPGQVTPELKPGTAWVAYSDEWEEEARQVFAAATQHIQSVAAGREANTWAVILDIDETVLNNVEYQVIRERAGLSYTRESWFDWTQQEAATLVPGAKEFIDSVNSSGGLVAFVTNRLDTEQLATENNLESLGIRRRHDFRVLLTRSPQASSSKELRFELVRHFLAVQGFPNVDIVAFVGDGRGDKPAELGESRFFCVDQGAMYGEPCAVVPGPGI